MEEQKSFIKSLNEDSDEPKTQSFSVIFEVLLLLAIVHFLVFLFINTRNSQKISLAEAEIKDLESQFQNSDLQATKKQLDDISDRLKLFNQFNKTTKSYEDFWTQIKQRLVKDASYDSLALNEKGEVSVTGKAKSYESIAKLLASLKTDPPIFQKVKLTNANSEETYKTFTMTFIYQPEGKTAGETTTTSQPTGGTNE